MYEYDPESSKKKEKLILLGILSMAAVLLGFAYVPQIPYSLLFQAVSFSLLVGACFFISRFLSRDYVYQILPGEDENAGASPDLVITEYYGKRRSTVCRVSIDDIEQIEPLGENDRKKSSPKLPKSNLYDYTASLSLKNAYLLTVRDGDRIFYVKILADLYLLSLLEVDKEQYLSLL